MERMRMKLVYSLICMSFMCFHQVFSSTELSSPSPSDVNEESKEEKSFVGILKFKTVKLRANLFIEISNDPGINEEVEGQEDKLPEISVIVEGTKESRKLVTVEKINDFIQITSKLDPMQGNSQQSMIMSMINGKSVLSVNGINFTIPAAVYSSSNVLWSGSDGFFVNGQPVELPSKIPLPTLRVKLPRETQMKIDATGESRIVISGEAYKFLQLSLDGISRAEVEKIQGDLICLCSGSSFCEIQNFSDGTVQSTLSGATRFVIKDFNRLQKVKLDCSGASECHISSLHIKGKGPVPFLSVHASGASKVHCNFDADEVDVDLSGASHTVLGSVCKCFGKECVTGAAKLVVKKRPLNNSNDNATW